ncbi:hypothetical protein [Granulibacter bethesdensis]|uniref:hypothetical protein n=1 Tax=Granulibacter bethesdensis TaxID=364410 RepID=UPI0009333756|nr:hypothetical protein [Granulibacter bethesdensis]
MGGRGAGALAVQYETSPAVGSMHPAHDLNDLSAGMVTPLAISLAKPAWSKYPPTARRDHVIQRRQFAQNAPYFKA